VLDNDMHALAARWLLTDRADHEQDILMVTFGDGHLGAALLVDGRPNRGCATGGNELGHTRFPVETERCFCGHTGCMERIVSSGFLALRDRASNGKAPQLPPSLDRRAARFKEIGGDPALDEMMRHLACALANAVNFVRPHRLVLISPFTRHAAFGDELVRQTRALALPHLAERVRFDLWNEDVAVVAETAAWLAMAELLYGGWNQIHTNAQQQPPQRVVV
jgi:predicted NBD/HSP70 family sugar kinase